VRGPYLGKDADLQGSVADPCKGRGGVGDPHQRLEIGGCERAARVALEMHRDLGEEVSGARLKEGEDEHLAAFDPAAQIRLHRRLHIRPDAADRPEDRCDAVLPAFHLHRIVRCARGKVLPFYGDSRLQYAEFLFNAECLPFQTAMHCIHPVVRIPGPDPAGGYPATPRPRSTIVYTPFSQIKLTCLLNNI
jgi:hypothetical protein